MPLSTPNGNAPGSAVGSIIDQARQLLNQGRCPLPVAPAFPAELYPAKNKGGKIQLDKDGNPKPAFTGKNPSYIDAQGKPQSVNHARYQANRPTEQDVSTWFANSATGIGELCGFEGLYQLDWDSKNFESVEASSAAFFEWRDRHPQLTNAPIERTHSGGFHLQIKLETKPDFTNFALEPGGAHIGELLGSGRFCVLAPTIGPSDKAYEVLQDGNAPLIEDLGAIGIYSTRKPPEAAMLALLASTPPASPQGSLAALSLSPIALSDLLCENARKVLGGEDIKGDKSASFTVLNKESAGWVNWCNLNGVPVSGSVEDLARQGGAALGYGEADIKRKLKTIDQGGCLPACCQGSDDSSAWKKIKRLSLEIWSAHRLKDQAEPDPKPAPSPVGSDPFEADRDLQETKIESLQSCNYQLGKWKNKEIEAGQIPNYEKRKAQGDKTIGKIAPTKKVWALPDGSMQSLKAKRKENDGGEEVITAANVLIFEPLLGLDFEVTKFLKTEGDSGGAYGIKAEWLAGTNLQTTEFLIKGTDTADVRKFIPALYKGLGSPTLCKLTGHDIQELFQAKKFEYFARGGKTYRLAPCTGQQDDGYWVFENMQFRPDGAVCAEEESGWVFNESLGEEELIPSPQIAEQDPQAIANLVKALQAYCPSKTFKNILFCLGYAAATVNHVKVRKETGGHFPQAVLSGERNGGKTLGATAGASMTGTHKPNAVIGDFSPSMLGELTKSVSGCLLLLDDPIKPGEGQKDAKKKVRDVVWRVRDGKGRKVRGNDQIARSNLIVTSNVSLADGEAAAESRLFSMHFSKPQGEGFKNSGERALSLAMDKASGGLSQLIALGYNHNEVLDLKARLLAHLAGADSRVVEAFALVTWYTQKVCELANYEFDAFTFCVENLCPQANEAGSGKSALEDFLEKLRVLCSEGKAGGWNVNTIRHRATGKDYLTVNMGGVWPLFDQKYRPNYGQETIRNLAESAGGKRSENAKFVGSKDQWNDYLRACFEAERATSDSDLAHPSSGAPRVPKAPKKSAGIKSVWIPIEVVKKLTGWDPLADDYSGPTEEQDDGPQSAPEVPAASAAAPNPVKAPVLVSRPLVVPPAALAPAPAAPVVTATTVGESTVAAAVTADPEPTVCEVGWGIGDRADLLDDGLDDGLDDDGDDLRLGLGEDQDSVDEEVWA
jgi:hypothetical protein